MFGKQKFVYCLYCEPFMFGVNGNNIHWDNSNFVTRNNFLYKYACKNLRNTNSLKTELEKNYPNCTFEIRKFFFDKVRGCFTMCLY